MSDELPKCGLVGRYYEKNIKFEKKHVITEENPSDDNLNGKECDLVFVPSHVE